MLTRKRKYDDARARLEDARLCFDWAGGAEEELRELNSVEGELEVYFLVLVWTPLGVVFDGGQYSVLRSATVQDDDALYCLLYLLYMMMCWGKGRNNCRER